MNRTSWKSQIPAVMLCLMGAAASALLMSPSRDLSAFGCSDGSDGCASVLAGRWSVFPPAAASPADATAGFTIPVSVLGFGYFAFLTGWLLFIGQPDPRRRAWHLVPLLVSLAGVAVSVTLLGVMATTGQWCPVCVGAHLLNFGVFASVISLWPGKPAGEQMATGPVFPAPRLVGSVVTLGLATGLAGGFWQQASTFKSDRDALAAKFERISQDADVVAWMQSQQPRQEITVRNDDPAIPATHERHSRLVVFTDLQCTWCRRFREQLDGEILPAFDGRLEVVFKHFPLCPDCNDGSQNVHAYACDAAYLAEAARLQAGTEGFLRVAHLIESRPNRTTPWSGGELSELAAEAELDPERFQADFRNPAVRNRVREDARLGRTLGVTGSPALFLDGRRVDTLVRDFPAFWNLAAERLQRGDAGLPTFAMTSVHKPALDAVPPANAERASHDHSVPDTAPAASSSQRATPSRTMRLSSIELGDTLELAGPTLTGPAVDLREYRGKVVLVDFWASWCGHCVLETPYLQRLYDLYHEQGLEIIGVSADKTRDDLERFVTENQLPWPQIFYDEDGKRGRDNPACQQHRVRGYPCMVVVDRQGKVISLLPRGHGIEAVVAEALGVAPSPREAAEAELAKYRGNLKRPQDVTPPPLPQVEIGQVLDVRGPTADGGSFDLRDYRGRPTLVLFWASWCGYCKKEMPNIIDVYQRHHADGFEVVGISVDRSLKELQGYVEQNKLPWTQLYDDRPGSRGFDNPLCFKYRVSGVPTMYLVDGEGRVVHTRPRGSVLEQEVARLLGKTPAIEPTPEPVPRPDVTATDKQAELESLKNLSDYDMARLVIERYDTNRDGVLQREEWSKMRGNPARYDLNGDGLVTVEEFAQFVARLNQQPAPDAGKPAAGPSATVPTAAVPEAGGMSTADLARKIIEQFDKNGDGRLQEEEWKLMPGQPHVLDTNGDGIITAEELEAMLKLPAGGKAAETP